MKTTALISSFLIIALISCENQQADKRDFRPFTASESKIAESGSSFGLQIFKSISQAAPDSNLFISPLSISMALSMALNGASDSTYSALRNTLGFETLTLEEINTNYKSLIGLLQGLDPDVIFEIANSIWYRNTYLFNQKFLNDNQNYYNALVTASNFNDPNTVHVINNWVKQKTRNKITSIIAQIDPEIIMILLNAIYFKGTWTYEFDKKLTQVDQFTVSGGYTVPCKMLKQSGDFGYYQNDQFQCVDLPYGNGIFRMTILLPVTNNSVNSFISGISKEQFDTWTADMTIRRGTVLFPKFKFAYERRLNDVLSGLGMEIAFIPGAADFTNLDSVNGRDIFIHSVRHKSFVQVDEEGTEAAAVTSVEFGVTSVSPNDRFYFLANRPFVFVIRESRANTILFIGKVMNPVWMN